VTDHYAVTAPGSLESLTATEHATGADWDKALADAQQRSLADPDSYFTVRHNSRGLSQTICTVQKGELLWPRQPTPHVDLKTGYLAEPDFDLEA
jgi:hypothetical protein